MQRISSIGNLNNISGVGNLNLTPLHQIGLLDIYMNNNLNSMNNMNQINNMNNMSLNSIKNSNPNLFNNSNNNLFQLNQDNLVKGTLLSPPPKYHFNLGKSTMIPVTDKNNTNFTFSNSIGDKNIKKKKKVLIIQIILIIYITQIILKHQIILRLLMPNRMMLIRIKVKSQEAVNLEVFQEMGINGKFLLWSIKRKDMLEVIQKKKMLQELMIKSLYKIMALKLKLISIILNKKLKKF